MKEKRQLKQFLVKNSLIPEFKLKKRLIQENLKESKCESCELTEWMGSPIPLVIQRENRDKKDNRLQNLKMVCPNCKSLSDQENKRGDKLAKRKNATKKSAIKKKKVDNGDL